MEILALIVLVGVFAWWGYRQLNKEDQNGRHPLDAVIKDAPVVNNKTGEPVVNPQITDAVTQSNPAWHTAPAEGSKLAENPLDVNHDGKVNLADVVEAVKKTRGRVKKAADTNGDGKVTVKDVKVAAKKVKATATKKVAAVKAKAKPARSKKA